MADYLLIGAVVVFACIFFNRISSRFGIPALFAFIVLGMLFGSDGIVKIPFADYQLAEMISTAALVEIMFYGGFGTNWRAARPVAGKAALLSSAGVLVTAGLTGLFCHFILGLEWLEGMLLGAVLGSTDAASVFSILRSKKLNLRYGTASILEVESGSNDPFAYMLAVILLSAMRGDLSGWAMARMIVLQVILGVVFGVLIGIVAVFVMRRSHCAAPGFDAAYVMAAAAFSYALPAMLGGNGFLSVYITGLILGNQRIPNKPGLVHFFDGVTGLMQMLLFFLLGLLSFPSRIPQTLFVAVPAALFLTFIARPAAVFILLSPLRCPPRQQAFIAWAGLRGAASIVFAVMVMGSGVSLDMDIFHSVFFVVLLSIAFQGALLPWAARKLDMIDDGENVLKTFSDYAEDTDIQFIQLVITEDHSWNGAAVRDLSLPQDILLAAVLRKQETLVPRGDTVLEAGDRAVLAAAGFQDESHIRLYEVEIDKNHPWQGTPIHSLPLDPGELVVMIRRGREIVIPSGNTMILAGDILVVNRAEE